MKIIIILLSVIVLVSCQSTSNSNQVTIKPVPQVEKSAYSPIVRVDPKYPLKAAKAKQHGWVHLTYDVDKLGKVQNIKLIDVSPKGFNFEYNAYRALSKWRFKPLIIDGVEQDIVEQNVTMIFSVH